MTALRSEFPLTRFLGRLLAYTPAQLREADPAKAADHYGINPAHAAGYIAQQRELQR
jgi:hypothetical protein